MSGCECYQIGGPWVSFDPQCAEHGYAAQERDARMERLEQMKLPERMWINQPSTLQPLHKLHGTNVLAALEYDSTYRVYFLSGDIISMQCDGLCLSKGWR